MAVKPQKAKTRKSQQIEPLDWSAMAQSPALKGMVSFLEVTPEDIRRQRDTASEARTGGDTHTGGDARIGRYSNTATGQYRPERDANQNGLETKGQSHTIRDTHIGIDTHTGSEPSIGDRPPEDGGTFEARLVEKASETAASPSLESGITASEPESESKATISRLTTREDAVVPVREESSASLAAGESRTGSDPRTGHNAHTGSDTRTGSDTHTESEPQLDSGLSGQIVQLSTQSPQTDRTVSETRTGSASLIGGDKYGPRNLEYPGEVNEESHEFARQPQGSIARLPVSETRTDAASAQYAPNSLYTRPTRRMPMIHGEVIWQNRRIRKCVLAQDAHSQGEDALFSAMWSAAKPDPRDPSGSRTIRIGYAELAQKSRMHRSNVRINIAGLRAKLAIEVLDEHDSRDVTPRTYRLYSFKEILERRRVAGLEYVIRKKSVVFVTETGEVLPLPGLPKASVRKPRNSDSNGSVAVSRFTYQEASPEQMDLDVRQISDALSQHWAVDEAAAHQLLRQCRGVRRDAEIDEIVFFINEKLHIALTNKNIKNPTGLVLATVPQCFEGETFLEFRRRRNEVLRHTAEEEERKRQQEREMEQWLASQIDALRATAADHTQPESVRSKAERELKLYGG